MQTLALQSLTNCSRGLTHLPTKREDISSKRHKEWQVQTESPVQKWQVLAAKRLLAAVLSSFGSQDPRVKAESHCNIPHPTASYCCGASRGLHIFSSIRSNMDNVRKNCQRLSWQLVNDSERNTWIDFSNFRPMTILANDYWKNKQIIHQSVLEPAYRACMNPVKQNIISQAPLAVMLPQVQGPEQQSFS